MPLTAKPKLAEFERGYFVGLLEGEGSLTVSKNTEKRAKGKRTRSRLGFTLEQNIRIHNTSKELLERLQTIIGGHIYLSGRAKGTNKTDYKRNLDM